MLDIKFIRENSDAIREAVRKKSLTFDLDYFLALDAKRREKIQAVEALRAKQNRASEAIAELSGDGRAEKISEMQELKAKLGDLEFEATAIETEFEELMLRVPNVPDASVPEGTTDADNVEVKKWGEIPTFDFEPKSHIDLMLALDMADFERGTKVSGFRGYFLKNAGALLAFAIWNHAERFFLEKGFTPVIAPSLVKREVFQGTGYLPHGEDDLYKTQDGEFLAGTAEVGLMGYYMDETIDADLLPIKFLGFSPCFRREAGSYGKDVKGLIRVHEFYKWEQVVLCEADHDESVKWHEWLNRNTEEFIETFGIPYHTVVNCTGDLGLGQVKKYDIELWVPGENTYREIGSSSYFHDFQTRRLGIRYREKNGTTQFAHSLNSTAIPTPRILVSIIENYQQKDGSVKIPEALWPYMHGVKEIKS